MYVAISTTGGNDYLVGGPQNDVIYGDDGKLRISKKG